MHVNINLKGLRQSAAIYFTLVLDWFTVQLEHVLETIMDSSICTCMEGGSGCEPPIYVASTIASCHILGMN